MEIQQHMKQYVAIAGLMVMAGVYAFLPQAPNRTVSAYPLGKDLRYTGNLKENLFDGQGTLRSPSGIYEGHFSEGRFSGDGNFQSVDGWQYSANFIPKKGSHDIIITLDDKTSWIKGEKQWTEKK